MIIVIKIIQSNSRIEKKEFSLYFNHPYRVCHVSRYVMCLEAVVAVERLRLRDQAAPLFRANFGSSRSVQELSQNFGNSCPSRKRKSRSDPRTMRERTWSSWLIAIGCMIGRDRELLQGQSEKRKGIFEWIRNDGKCLRETREDAKRMRGTHWIICRRKFSASSWGCCHCTTSLVRFVWSPGRRSRFGINKWFKVWKIRRNFARTNS